MSDLVASLVLARQEMAPLVADETAEMGKYRFKYVGLGAMLGVVMPPLLKHGVMLTQDVGSDDAGYYVVTNLAKGSESMCSTPLHIDVPRNDAREMGKAVTTLRRVQLMAFLGLAPVDEDEQDVQREGQSQGVSFSQRQDTQREVGTHRLNEGGAACPECHAPAGKPHATSCSRARSSSDGGARPAEATLRDVGDKHVDTDFGMDKGGGSYTPSLDFYANLAHDYTINPFEGDEVVMRMVADYRKWDADPSNTAMPTEVKEGKKMSMYGYLASLIDKECGEKGAHNVVLTYLLGRPIHKMSPPPYSMKVLIDDLTRDNAAGQATRDVMADIYQGCTAAYEGAS